VARKLVDHGFQDVYALKGGWKEWHKQRFPIEAK
jgi:rhodanese-related sulfurtransferase